MSLKQRLLTPMSLLVLALLAAWPVIKSGPPLLLNTITDGPNHLHRFVLLAWHVGHGDWYPRWFSDLHFGYGAPVLNFYAPLSYYVLLALHVFVPSEPTTFMLGFVLAIGVAVVGLYVWARDHFDSPLAGITTAAAGVFVPYVYYTVLDRAAYPEMWGLALAPWLFWSALRVVRQPSVGRWATLAGLYAVFILTHNLSALLFTPILLIYSLLVWLEVRKPLSLITVRPLLVFGSALALAIGLAAFFLVPFALESSNIQLNRTTAYNYQYSFESITELFSPPVTFDPRYILDRKPLSIPWPQMGLAALALGGVMVTRKGKQRVAIVVNAALVTVLMFMTLAVSQPLWEIIPFTSVIQFTFRLFAPAMLLLAWLSGAAIVYLPIRFQRWAALVAVGGMFLFTLSWTFHKPYDKFPDTIHPADIIQDEITHPYRVGTTNLMEFLPRWVKELPPNDAVVPRYAEAEIPSRIGQLPEGVMLINEQTTLKTDDIEYSSSQQARLTLNMFYFPGWTATLDGQNIQINPSDPNGLIQVDLPAGQHHLQVALVPTGPQITGTLISLVALVLLVVPFGVSRRVPKREPMPEQGGVAVPVSGLSLLFIVLGLGLLVFRVGVADRVETPFYHVQLERITHPLAVNFGDQLTLMGFEYPHGETFSSGSSVDVNLYWQIRQLLTTDYQVGVQLVDEAGNHFGQSDHQNIDGVPTSQWTVNDYGRDEHQVLSLSGTPPGMYHLWVNVYSLQNGASQPLTYHVEGADDGVIYDLGTITITRGQPQPVDSLQTLEANPTAKTIGVGDQLSFTLLFNSGPKPEAGLMARLSLSTPNGQNLFSTDLPPAGPTYPSEQWTPNELIRYPHSVTLPPDLPAGPVAVSLTFVNAQGAPASAPFEMGKVAITVPDRSFVVPPMAHAVNYDYGGLVRLLGYDLGPESITFYWQALKPITTRYTVFVHNFDSANTFIAGNDSPPARVTTSWLPGEVITDVHPLTITDHFDVGLYDTVTGERLGEAYISK